MFTANLTLIIISLISLFSFIIDILGISTILYSAIFIIYKAIYDKFSYISLKECYNILMVKLLIIFIYICLSVYTSIDINIMKLFIILFLLLFLPFIYLSFQKKINKFFSYGYQYIIYRWTYNSIVPILTSLFLFLIFYELNHVINILFIESIVYIYNGPHYKQYLSKYIGRLGGSNNLPGGGPNGPNNPGPGPEVLVEHPAERERRLRMEAKNSNPNGIDWISGANMELDDTRNPIGPIRLRLKYLYAQWRVYFPTDLSGNKPIYPKFKRYEEFELYRFNDNEKRDILRIQNDIANAYRELEEKTIEHFGEIKSIVKFESLPDGYNMSVSKKN